MLNLCLMVCGAYSIKLASRRSLSQRVSLLAHTRVTLFVRPFQLIAGWLWQMWWGLKYGRRSGKRVGECASKEECRSQRKWAYGPGRGGLRLGPWLSLWCLVVPAL